MTERQAAVLRATADYIDAHGYAPSIRDLMPLCGISSSSVVARDIRRLEAVGLVLRDPLVARSLRLTDVGRMTVELEGR